MWIAKFEKSDLFGHFRAVFLYLIDSIAPLLCQI